MGGARDREVPENSSCPGLSRASTFSVPRGKAWMAGTSPAMTELLATQGWQGNRPYFAFSIFVTVYPDAASSATPGAWNQRTARP